MAKNNSAITPLTTATTKHVAADLQSGYDLIRGYLTKFSAGKKSAALDMLDNLIDMGLRFQATEKVYKVAQGMTYAALKNTIPENEYIEICKNRFGITTMTADKYALIYEAWLSGDFVYSLPDDPQTDEPYNFLSLSMRDMEFGASLIVAGEMTDDAAHTLFGTKGNWMEKREVIKKKRPKIVKRVRRQQKKRRHYVTQYGDVMITKANGAIEKAAFFDIKSKDQEIRVMALRMREAVKKELGFDVE